MASSTTSKKRRVNKMAPFREGDLVFYCKDEDYFIENEGEGAMWDAIEGAVMQVTEVCLDNYYAYTCTILDSNESYTFSAEELELAAGMDWSKRRTNKLGLFPRQKGAEKDV